MLTYDETMILAIYNTGTRKGTKDVLTKMRTYLEPDETELRELTDTVIRKLEAMSDDEYAALDLIPDFDAEEETDAG
ncbi:MAG: transposon-transfer assisting family protein [Clostridia bacterium]|nr:transposon-transfer assisting family protein [Clostridia bacterium]